MEQGMAENLAAKACQWLAVAACCGFFLVMAACGGVRAQEKPAANAVAPPPDKRPAKQVFGHMAQPTATSPEAIGFYAKGCLAGAKALATDGPAWQVMRLSRNRNWGHPALVDYLGRFARDLKAKDGWSGLLIGDMSQPRGGPMLTGHASHQIGLDVDIWYDPMPRRKLSLEERETTSASNVLANVTAVDPARWTKAHNDLIRRAASYPQVERVFVHPAIKKALCEAAVTDRGFLQKVRPIQGHDDHFHVRLFCPTGSTGCEAQKPTTGEEGCDKELDEWFKLLTAPPKPVKPQKPAIPKPPMMVEALPGACRAVLTAGAPSPKPVNDAH